MSRPLFAVLAVVYAVFWFWYGGSGEPISASEGATYMAAVRARYLDNEGKGKAGHPEMLGNFERMIANDDG